MISQLMITPPGLDPHKVKLPFKTVFSQQPSLQDALAKHSACFEALDLRQSGPALWLMSSNTHSYPPTPPLPHPCLDGGMLPGAYVCLLLLFYFSGVKKTELHPSCCHLPAYVFHGQWLTDKQYAHAHM